MGKIAISITVDPQVYFAIRKDPKFNVSGFCNEQLRRVLNVKELEIPDEEETIKEAISKRSAEMTILETKYNEMKEKRLKEEKEKKKKDLEMEIWRRKSLPGYTPQR